MLTKLQIFYPKKLISFLAQKIANNEIKIFKNWLVKLFIKTYGVDLTASKIQNYKEFINFNAFFTRELAHEILTIPNTLISPADGQIQNFGLLDNNEIINAKKRHFILAELLANNKYLYNFKNGNFFTVYLSPKDYHRVHMPYSGKLLQMDYIPGKLFSVNQQSTENINNIFSRNERVICYFESEFGVFAVILVGAIIVGSISTVWHGIVNKTHSSNLLSIDYHYDNIVLNQAEEMGRFSLGSTAIILTPRDLRMNFSIKTGQNVKTGDIISQINN